MMDEKIKQTIEEIELVMHNAWGCRYFNTKDMKLNNDRFFNREATAIYNAGYRKESDTARDFAKTIKSVVWEEFENETIRIKDLRGVIDDILRSKYGVEVEE